MSPASHQLRIALAACAALALTGCPTIRMPQLAGPGSAGYQRSNALQFDPYPLDDVAPPVAGGRPREYDRPIPEVKRGQIFTPKRLTPPRQSPLDLSARPRRMSSRRLPRCPPPFPPATPTTSDHAARRNDDATLRPSHRVANRSARLRSAIPGAAAVRPLRAPLVDARPPAVLSLIPRHFSPALGTSPLALYHWVTTIID